MATRIQLPRNVKRGDVVTVRVAIQHAMETGYRVDESGRPIARNVIRAFTCRYKGAEVLRAELSSGISANPLLEFHLTASDSGEVEIEWLDDQGTRETAKQLLVVGA